MDNPRFPPPDPSERLIEELLRLAGARERAPAERLERIKAAARSEWTRVATPRRSHGRVWFLGAAAATIALLVWSFTPDSDRAPDGRSAGTPALLGTIAVSENATLTGRDAALHELRSGASLSAGDLLQTRSGGIVAVRLADGYSIRLNEQTNVRFESSHVLALTSGAVYLDSGQSADGRAPLEIRTPFGNVRNQGTQFEVRVQSDTLRVRVREGVVLLDRASQSHTARAGQQLTVLDRGEVSTTAIETHGADWIWIGRAPAPFDVAGRTLGQFLEWTAREGGYRIQFVDAGLERSTGGIVLEGSIAGLSAEDALTVVLPTCGLRHRLIDGTAIVERATERR